MIPLCNDKPSATVPFMTWFLMAVNVGLFVYELLLPAPELESLLCTYGIIPDRFWDWQGRTPEDVLRFCLMPCFTSMFLHGGWLHVIGNVWSLWLFGHNIEDRLGHFRFVLFYVLTGLLAGILHVSLNYQSPVPCIGASGAIAGVMGAYFLLFPFSWITVLIPVIIIPVFIKIPAFFYLLLWIVSQVMGGYGALTQGEAASAGIAFWAHVGGFLGGMYWIRRWRRRRPRRSRRR